MNHSQSPLYSYDFLSLGEALVDLISVDVVNTLKDAKNFERFVGGQAANLAMNMALLGKHTALAACVGNNGLGQFIQEQAAQAGVNTSLVQTSRQAPTTTATITRNTQTPDFIIHRGADAYLRATPELLEAVAASRVVHTSAFALSREPARTTILSALRVAKANKARVSLDPNYHPDIWPDSLDFVDFLKDAFQFVDITKPSLDDCTRIFGPRNSPAEYATLFQEWGAEIVLISMGERGVYLATGDGRDHHILASNSQEVADVTGAGDAYWAGFLSALLDGATPLEAARVGQVVAEIKIGNVGPLKNLPNWDLLRQRAAVVVVKQLAPSK